MIPEYHYDTRAIHRMFMWYQDHAEHLLCVIMRGLVISALFGFLVFFYWYKW